MIFMNEYEIEDAARRYAEDPVLGPASVTLLNLMEWTNRNSDGWPYWPKPCRAAKALQALLTSQSRYGWETSTVTLPEYRAALRPVKAFRTRQGADFQIVEAGA